MLTVDNCRLERVLSVSRGWANQRAGEEDGGWMNEIRMDAGYWECCRRSSAFVLLCYETDWVQKTFELVEL